MAAAEMGAWDREDISAWGVVGIEQRGSTSNRWLEEPVTGEKWLHKDTVTPRNGIEQGEDWSEIVSTQVARLLGVPAARTRLCTRHGRRGSISLSMHPAGHSLDEGSVVMDHAKVPGFFSNTEGRPGVDSSRLEVKRPGHSLANIRIALDGGAAPPGFDGPPGTTGFDVFSGYLVLDALIANQDRHEQTGPSSHQYSPRPR